MAEYGHAVPLGDRVFAEQFLRAVKKAQEAKRQEAEADARRIFEAAFSEPEG